MNKNTYFIIGGSALAIILLVGGVVLFWNSRNSDPVSFGRASIHEGSSTSGGDSTGGASSVGVSSGSGSTGQLLPGQSSGSNGGATGQSSNASSGSGGGSSSGSSNPFDPSTFQQYEKYKDSQQAMIGEVQKGTGATAEKGKKATVIYKGWLTNGQLFDQSKTGSDGKLTPFAFEVGGGQTITGWDQGISGMQVGGVRLIIVPPGVGYGANAQGAIPANSVLVFQVQLVSVE